MILETFVKDRILWIHFGFDMALYYESLYIIIHQIKIVRCRAVCIIQNHFIKNDGK